jgi:spore coat protein CotH
MKKINPSIIIQAIVLSLILIWLSSCKARGVKKPEFVQLPTYRIESDRNREGDLDYVFDLDALPVITIEISSNDFNTILTNFDRNPYNKEYVRADFVFDKDGKIDRFNNIGFRLRGTRGSKFRVVTGSKFYNIEKVRFFNSHFRISFNTYVESGRFYRLRNLILKWHNQDPLYAREILCYDLFNRFGATASRASYARVYLRIKEDGNEIAYGVHAMIEPVDRSFLLSRYDDNMGHLWQCGYPADLTKNLRRGLVGMEDPERGFRPAYDFKTHSEERGVLFQDAKTELGNFVTNINLLEGDEFEDWITNNMDIDGFLRTYAINVLVGSWDDYWNNANNYYIYRDSSGKWYFIPWDYDNTLGTGFNWGGGQDFSTNDVFDWGRFGEPLMNKIMARPNLRKIYSDYLTLALDKSNDIFNYKSIKTRIKKWNAMINEYVDPSMVDTMPFSQNNSHKIEDAPFMDYDAGDINFKLLSGNETNNYIIRRINSIKKQLELQ